MAQLPYLPIPGVQARPAKLWTPLHRSETVSSQLSRNVSSARTETRGHQSSGQGRLIVWAPLGAFLLSRRGRNATRRHSKRFALVRAAGLSETISWEEEDEETVPLPKGTAVKVVGEDITFWHAPGFKGKPYNPQGLEGEVLSVIEDIHLTPNRPVLVKLTKAPAQTEKFKAFNAHFARDEIEIVNAEASAEESAAASLPSADSDADDASLMHLQDDRWVINLLYDGDCPSCMKQVEFLQKRMDENPQYQGLVAFTNLHDPDYDPDLCGGVVFEDGMRHIHAVTRDGEVIAGMDVFRRIYSIVGMQWVYEITTLPLVGEFFDWLYDWFSEYRLRAAGREDILEKVHNHQAKIQELSATECDVECEVDWDHMDQAQAPKIVSSRVN